MEITIKELVDQLKVHDPDAIIHFEGFEFYRIKRRGDKIVQIELKEINTEPSEEEA